MSVLTCGDCPVFKHQPATPTRLCQVTYEDQMIVAPVRANNRACAYEHGRRAGIAQAVEVLSRVRAEGGGESEPLYTA